MARRLASTAILVPALVLASCASGGSAKLDGAVYASTVPVYSPASFDGQMGGTSYGDTPEETSEGQSWFFKTAKPMDEVVEFYAQKLQGWTRKDDKDGLGPSVTFTRVPDGAAKDEYVQVILRQGEVQIHESCKPGKIKR